MPTHVDEIRIYGRPGSHLWSYARIEERDTDCIKGQARLLDAAGHVAVEILGLRFDDIGRDAKRAAGQNLNDWLYEFQWRLKERPNEQSDFESSAPASGGGWLIFADSGGIGEALAALVNAQGGRSILVTRGDSYECTDGEHFRVRSEHQEDIRQLLEAVLAPDQPICRAVVHLWSLDARPPEEATVTSLQEAQTLGCGSVLRLVQELAAAERQHLPRLWLITRGAQPAGEETLPLDTAQAPLWGLGRVIPQEHPTLWGGLVDLELDASDAEDAAPVVEGSLCSRRRGSDCVPTRAAIRGPLGAQTSLRYTGSSP